MQVLPNLQPSKATQVKNLQRKLAEGDSGSIGKNSTNSDMKDLDIKVGGCWLDQLSGCAGAQVWLTPSYWSGG